MHTRSTNLTNLITDAIREFSGADVVMINSGGIRASINPGDITVRDIYNQVSGMTTVRFDPEKPAGSRVVAVLVAGRPIAADKLYTLAANDFMAAGGDGYVWFMQSTFKETARKLTQRNHGMRKALRDGVAQASS